MPEPLGHAGAVRLPTPRPEHPPAVSGREGVRLRGPDGAGTGEQRRHSCGEQSCGPRQGRGRGLPGSPSRPDSGVIPPTATGHRTGGPVTQTTHLPSREPSPGRGPETSPRRSWEEGRPPRGERDRRSPKGRTRGSRAPGGRPPWGPTRLEDAAIWGAAATKLVLAPWTPGQTCRLYPVGLRSGGAACRPQTSHRGPPRARRFLPRTRGVGLSLLRQMLTDSALPAAPSGRGTGSRLTGGGRRVENRGSVPRRVHLNGGCTRPARRPPRDRE